MSTEIPSPPKAGKQPLSVWELHRMIEPVHLHRRSKGKAGKERKHFPAIVSFLAKNRFAAATQIQRRFPDYLKSGRTCRRHLAELQDLGYIDTVAETVSPLWPSSSERPSGNYLPLPQGVTRHRPMPRSEPCSGIP